MSDEGLRDAIRLALQRFAETGASVAEIVYVLEGASHRGEVKRALRSMSRTGEVVRVDRDLYTLTDQLGLVDGALVFHHGAFFVVPNDDDDVLAIDHGNLSDAVAGDVVRARLTFDNGRGHRAGRVSSVVTRGPRQSRGRVSRDRDSWIVVSPEIGEPLALLTLPAGVQAGDEVAFRVGGRTRRVRHGGVLPRVACVAQVGPVDSASPAPLVARDAFRDIQAGETRARVLLDQLVMGLGLDAAFPDAAIAEANAYDEPQGQLDADARDLRETPLVTIDGADARDFDDAVYATTLPSGVIRLLVAIADVSHYVRPGMAIDDAARARGCSYYLPDRVHPMLPTRLSNELCSLQPERDRRCAWVSLDVGEDGRVLSRDLGFGLMRSWARLTYTDVEGLLYGGNAGDTTLKPPVLASLRSLATVYERLHRFRSERGMLDLHLPEPRFVLSEDGDRVLQVEAAPRLRSHRLIEECMLAANEAVADILMSQGWPAVLRTHGEPSDERLATLHTVASDLGVKVRLSPTPTIDEINRVIRELGDDPRSRIVSYLVLRTLPRATYGTEDRGHFGIGAGRYLHFTSPIRRYADLENHRLVRAMLRSEAPRGKALRATRAAADAAAEAANAGEDRANKCERWSGRLLRARFMMDHVGETFDGVVSEVLAAGIVVTIEEPYVDGFVPISLLGPAYYRFDSERMRMNAEGGGDAIHLADSVRVRCESVDLREGRVTFAREGVRSRGGRRRGSNRRG